MPVKPGDLFMVCSDGLTNMVPEHRIEGVLGNARNLNACVRELLELANKGGGEDNITVALIRVSGEFKAEEDWQTKMINWFDK